MRVCTACYKRLYRKISTPYDYVRDVEPGKFKSTCCNASTLEVDKRQYKRTVLELEEKKKLQG